MAEYIVTNDAELQTALAAQQDGDIITLAAGTYTTHVVVTADITINGAKQGRAGDSNSRGFGESVLSGGVQFNGDGATLDGVQVIAGGTGDDGFGAVEINADGVTVTNTYFLGSYPGSDDFAVSVNTNVSGFDMTDNAVRGWVGGVYVATGSSGTASSNLFDQNGNGINTESVLFVITENQFQYSIGADITLLPYDPAAVASDFVADDNTFVREDDARSIAIFPMTAGSSTTGTSYGDYFDASYGPVGDYGFSGGEGDDRAWGATGADTLGGDAGADTLYGQDGDDSLLGGAGNDTLNGENDDDVLEGGLGANVLNGDAGVDTASYANAANGVTVNLGIAAAQDTGAGTDTYHDIENLLGSASADDLTGDELANAIDGGDGDDTLSGGNGDDTVRGGAGADLLVGSAGADDLWGGADGDQLEGKVGDDVLNGEGGRDALNGGVGFDALWGGDSFDTLFGADGDDTLNGDGGNDTLIGGADDDTLNGGDGSDTASYEDAASEVSVNLSNDDGFIKRGRTGQDTGGAGWDTLVSIENLTGSRFDDTLTGDDAANIVKGGSGDDSLSGGDDADVLEGGKQDDVLHGDAGEDELDGGNGRDTLHGDLGDDLLTGGAKSDVFVFGIGHDDDTITDFTAGSGKGHDVISYDGSIFSDFDDVMAHAFQLGDDVVIVEDNGDTSRLLDVAMGELTVDNFSFIGG